MNLPAGKRTTMAIAGPAGQIETLVEMPEQSSQAVAVICHPHPQYGGSLDNKVVYALARAARTANCASLRFNFRGVGASDGAFDGGHGETDDALAVIDWAVSTAGNNRLLLAGFSFGAAVALRAAEQRAALGLTTVALPTGYFEQGLPRPDCPWLAMHGDADEVVDCTDARTALDTLKPPPDVVVLKDAGHFFHGRLSELGAIVDEVWPAWLDAVGAGVQTHE